MISPSKKTLLCFVLQLEIGLVTHIQYMTKKAVFSRRNLSGEIRFDNRWHLRNQLTGESQL